MKICILLRSFERGGAEHQASITAAELRRRGHDVAVVVFRQAPAYAEVLDAAGIAPHVLAGSQIGLLVRFRSWVEEHQPDVIMSYLAGPNLLAATARLIRNRPSVVWGVRSTSLRLGDETRLGRAVYRLEPMLSRWCDAAIANSYAARLDARERGFNVDQFDVVPNGVDTDRWRPSDETRGALRARHGLPIDGFVIGRIGRVHPMKDLSTLFRSVARLNGDPRVIIAVVGGGNVEYVEKMRREASSLGVAGDVVWVGERSDLDSVYPAMDVVVSSSAYGEGFPNVIGEALSSGVPCIGTDVGDTASLIGDERFVVGPGNDVALSAAIRAMFEIGEEARRVLGQAGRDRIVETYSVPALGDQLEAVLSTVTRRR